MIALNRRTKVFLSKEPADMRASYDTPFCPKSHAAIL